MRHLDNIELLRKAPARTPIIISHKLRKIIKNKIVCEVGCAEGDNMILLSKYAKKVIGLDLNYARLKHAKSRNLDVRLSDYRQDLIPKADVYYFWPSNTLRDVPFLIWKIVNNSFSNSIIISGCDNALKYDRLCSYIFSLFSERYSYKYYEGPAHREHGKFTINILYKSNLFLYHYPIMFFLIYLLRIYSFLILKYKRYNN